MGHFYCHSGLKRHCIPFNILEHMNPRTFTKGSGINTREINNNVAVLLIWPINGNSSPKLVEYAPKSIQAAL